MGPLGVIPQPFRMDGNFELMVISKGSGPQGEFPFERHPPRALGPDGGEPQGGFPFDDTLFFVATYRRQLLNPKTQELRPNMLMKYIHKRIKGQCLAFPLI